MINDSFCLVLNTMLTLCYDQGNNKSSFSWLWNVIITPRIRTKQTVLLGFSQISR